METSKSNGLIYFVDAHCDSLDMQPIQEETIKRLIENNHGHVDAGDPCPECNRGRITAVFDDPTDARMTETALTEIGIEAQMYVDAPVEPFEADAFDDLCECEDPENYLLISSWWDHTWVRREIVRLLTLDLVYYWWQFGPNRFLVLCKSAEAAMSLYEKLEGSPVENHVEADFIEDFEMLMA
ncbi:MAG: hypothetical protein ACLP9L_10865 [Thermoguttaceae bacterium]